jgi:hypothetical protein
LITTIRRDDVLKFLGYKQTPDRKVLHLIDEMLEEGRSLAAPLMRFKAIAHEKDPPLFLQGAASSYIALASIGPRLETRSKELFDEGNPTEGYLLDTIGSLAIMQVGDRLWEEIREDAASRGLKKGLRRAPGCDGVALELQSWIVATFHEPDMGIHVTPSSMLVPRKSFAFLARFGGELKAALSCKGCRQYADCTLRG